MQKTKILIAGVGGVGGYFGGLLARKYFDSDSIDIYFYARGEHLEKIREDGLRVISQDKEFITKANMATNDANEFGTVDYLIICTKTYDLEQTILQLSPCIDARTIILPLLNGVNSRDRISKIYPQNIVCDGCVYIIARLTEPGVIVNSGNIQKLYFGLHNEVKNEFLILEKIFLEANIEADLSTMISSIIWEKYIFISSIATATSYFDEPIGVIISTDKMRLILIELINEVKEIAEKKLISITNNINHLILEKLRSLPKESTSSLHSDIINNKPITEFGTLTEYVVLESKKMNLETPTFDRLHKQLSLRIKN